MHPLTGLKNPPGIRFMQISFTHASCDGENRSSQRKFRKENDRLQIEALTSVSPAGQGLQKHLRRMLGNGTVISVNQHAAESPQVSLRLPPLSPSVK